MKKNVIIVGGGWSGLSAAITLLDNQIPVTLFEAAPQLGGRARAIAFGDKTVDNGQHLLLGGYQAFNHLLNKLHVNSDTCFLKKPLNLLMHAHTQTQPHPPYHQKVHLQLKKLPSPLHAIWGLWSAKGLSIKDKWSAKRLLKPLPQQNLTENDLSVSTLLQNTHQSPWIRTMIWEPLCLASLSTLPAEASAHVFLNVLEDVFTQKSSYPDFWFAKKHLSEVLPNPGAQYIRDRQGKIYQNTRVKQLIFNQNRCTGVQTQEGTYTASHIILAIPPKQALNLLPEHIELTHLKQNLAQMAYEPITTVYCQYPEHIHLSTEMVGLTGSISQWVFDRKFAKQPGLMAVVITGKGPHQELGNDTLTQTIAKELHQQFGFPPFPLHSRVIREKQGAFSCQVGIQSIRPSNQTNVPGLFLAGDYTQSRYPASIESAVQSGISCGEKIIRSEKLKYPQFKDNTNGDTKDTYV